MTGIAALLTVAMILVVGYRMGRTHAAWRDVGFARRSVSASRRIAWRHTLAVALSAVALLITLAAAGYTLSAG